MIDIHFHCLPGIDDGPSTWAEAVDLCRAASAGGVDTIFATPHVLREPWLNSEVSVRAELLAELNRLLSGNPIVLPGCEYFLSSDGIELWQRGRGGPLVGLNETSYLLVEFPATRVPDYAAAIVHEFSITGVRPVIAHPERNVVLASHPDKLRRLVELGALVQITAASVLGSLGSRIQKVCDTFFQQGLVHFVASDAHSLERRPPCLDQARNRVRESWGADAESVLFDVNPAAVLEGVPLPGPFLGDMR